MPVVFSLNFPGNGGINMPSSSKSFAPMTWILVPNFIERLSIRRNRVRYTSVLQSTMGHAINQPTCQSPTFFWVGLEHRHCSKQFGEQYFSGEIAVPLVRGRLLEST